MLFKNMSRRTARENLFKVIYESCVNHDRNEFTLSLITSSSSEEDISYIKTVYNGIEEKYDYLSGLISEYSKSFAIERIYKVDLAIILIAAYEILYMPEIPKEVSVNEALELSKIYSTEKSYKFINGILAQFIGNKESLANECGNN